MQESTFLRHSELKELVQLIRHEVQKAQRPASEIILDDADLKSLLKISQRKLQYLLADRIIPYHNLPHSPRRYYLLQDILDLLGKNRIENIASKF